MSYFVHQLQLMIPWVLCFFGGVGFTLFLQQQARSVFRHLKRGSSYYIVRSYVINATNGPNEGQVLVIYEDIDKPGNVYARERKQFFDGRFERVK